MTRPLGPTRMQVQVPLTGLWARPDAPRECDSALIADRPDQADWLAALDAQPPRVEHGRLGLLGRLESQLLNGEPVIVHERLTNGWSRVSARWQPSSKHGQGYPGFVRSAHLTDGDGDAFPSRQMVDSSRLRTAVVAQARVHLGLPYLWGGLSDAGLDCSGLVHLTYRKLGVRTPRDADDQQAAARPLDPAEVQPGDLYFFARAGRPAHHVGIATALGRMIHAPMTGLGITEEAITGERAKTLVGAGRLYSSSLPLGR